MSTNIEMLVNTWITSGQRKGSEYVDKAYSALAGTDSPVNLITFICPNFEIGRRNGQRTVEIHDSFIHDELGNLRRGYAAMEEISAIHEGLMRIGRGTQHSIVIVDNAIQWQPAGADQATDNGVRNLQKLVEIQLKDRGINSDSVRVRRLSDLIPKMEADFGVDLNKIWTDTTQAMWGLVNEPNNPVAGILRRELPKETRYLQAEWRVESEEEARHSLIRDQYALTALVGRAIPLIHAVNWGIESLPREKHILVDAISGPQEDKHNAEYALYNLSCPSLDRALSELDSSPLPVVRAIRNVALWSSRAVDAPIAGKTVEKMTIESWKITESGIVLD